MKYNKKCQKTYLPRLWEEGFAGCLCVCVRVCLRVPVFVRILRRVQCARALSVPTTFARPRRGKHVPMYMCTVCVCVCRVLINMQLYLLLLHVWSCPSPCLLLLSPPFRAHSKVRDCDFASTSASASASRILACVDCRLACPAPTLHATTLSPHPVPTLVLCSALTICLGFYVRPTRSLSHSLARAAVMPRSCLPLLLLPLPPPLPARQRLSFSLRKCNVRCPLTYIHVAGRTHPQLKRAASSPPLPLSLSRSACGRCCST